MNRLPNIKLPPTEKQLSYLKRLTKSDVGASNKYEAWEKIQRILKERGDPNIKAIKSPTLIEWLTIEKIKPLMSQLGKLSNSLEFNKYSNEFVDAQFGFVTIEIKSDTNIQLQMNIVDAKDYLEIIIMRKMRKNFRSKYSLGVIFQQNKDYLISFYKLVQLYYKTYHPDIKLEIVHS